MRSIVLANVPHYYYLAHALFRVGALHRFVTSVGLMGDSEAPKWLPAYWRRRLETRRFADLPPERVRRQWLPELLQKMLPLVKISGDRANWVNNNLFDLLALRAVEPCDTFHFVNSIGLFSATKARKLGATLICDVREAHPDFQLSVLSHEYERLGLGSHMAKPSYYWRMKSELSIADYIFVPSTFARDTLISQGIDQSKICTLMYGVDTSIFREAPSNREPFSVIYAGRITPGKGIHYLLEAVTQLGLSSDQVLLVGTIDPIMQPILSGYRGTFHHINAVPRSELPALYHRASVFVFPSLTDAFGLTVIEAMACGLPVVVTSSTGARDAVRNGTDGFVLEPRDVDALVDRLAWLRDHPHLRRAMGQEAARRARSVTWERYEEQVARAYARLQVRSNAGSVARWRTAPL